MAYQKHNIIWDKFNTNVKKEFDIEPVYSKEVLKIKIKSHGDEFKNFYDKKTPKADSNYTYLAVSSLDSALKKYEIYYLEVSLKECKYIEKKIIRRISDNLSAFSSSDESDGDYMFLNKYLSCLFSLLLTHKHTYKV